MLLNLNTDELVTPEEFRRRHPNTSFPVDLTPEDVSFTDYILIKEAETLPVLAYNEKLLVANYIEDAEGYYVPNYSVVFKSQEELVADFELAAAGVRYERDKLLRREVDSINQMRWEDLNETERQAWRDYRQSLLDIPEQVGFPWSVTWPVKPS